MDLISIIIPYYKKKKFIDQSLKSIFSQTHFNYEVLIIYDDQDQTDLYYLRDKYSKNPKVKFIVNQKNLGAGKSRNIGINKSQGRYIAFLDADDIWKENKIKKQLEFMKNAFAKASHTSYEIINEKNQIIGFRKAKHFKDYKELLKSCDIGLSSVIIEKNIFKDDVYFAHLKTKEDFVLWLKILQKKIQFYALDENLLSWRKNENSLSSSIKQKLFDGFKVYNKYMNFNFLTSLYYLFILSINFILKNMKIK